MGLVATHEKKTAHGKLCPENLWVDLTGTVKLIQFPLAPAASRPNGSNCRWPITRAPELRDPQQPASGVADIYALGCILFELIAGRARPGAPSSNGSNGVPLRFRSGLTAWYPRA